MFRMSKLIIFFIYLFLFCGCSNEKTPVPSNPFDIYIDLNRVEFNSFSPGTHVFVTGGGSGFGIVIYRFTDSKFAAFDRMCTSTTHDPTRVNLSEQSDLFLECPDCSSKYIIYDGSVISGPARFFLTEYQTYYYSNSNTLRITN